MATDQPASTSLREDLIANAVGFLSNPKVRTSPEAPKRQFLENKGLTTAEIDEAFRRVPQQDTTESTPTTTVATTPPSKPFHATITPAAPTSTQQLAPAPPPVQRLRWSQVVMGAALLAAGAYTAHSLLWPRAQQLYHRWTASWREAQRRQEEQAAAHAKLVADALEAQSTELRNAVSSLKDLVSELRETRAAAGSTATIQELRDELRAISMAVNDASYTRSPDSMNGRAIAAVPQWTSITPSYSDPAPALPPPPHNTANKPTASDNGYVPPPTTGPDPPHPAQFMEVLEMLSRGETPTNVRTDIADAPPDPTQSPTEGRLAPRPKPWETQHASDSSKKNSPSPLQEQVANTQAWRPPPLPSPSLYSQEDA